MQERERIRQEELEFLRQKAVALESRRQVGRDMGQDSCGARRPALFPLPQLTA